MNLPRNVQFGAGRRGLINRNLPGLRRDGWTGNGKAQLQERQKQGAPGQDLRLFFEAGFTQLAVSPTCAIAA